MNDPISFETLRPWIEPVELGGHVPLAVSSTRYIYAKPGCTTELIKVHKEAQGSESLASWRDRVRNRKRRFIVFSGILREFEGYLEHHFLPHNPLIEHIMPVHGLVRTDLGVGMVVEKAQQEDGGLAPTLNQLIHGRCFDPAREESLRVFLDRLWHSPGRVGDLNLDNIVLAYHPNLGERFMLVDGLGERTWIPVQRWSALAYRRQKHRFFRKIQRLLTRYGIDMEMGYIK